MAKEYVYHGSSPADENCAQVGETDYEQKACKECRIYAQQLYRYLEKKGYSKKKGNIPNSYSITIKSELHDSGHYYEVVSSFDPAVEEAWNIALLIDNDPPEKWDSKALEDLGR